MDSDNMEGPSCLQKVQSRSGMQFAYHPEILSIHTATSMLALVFSGIACTVSWA